VRWTSNEFWRYLGERCVNYGIANAAERRTLERRMDVKDLRYFIAVYDTLSFSRAAALLKTVQSNVSARIRTLENDLRVELFARDSRTVTPTRRAKAIYRRARGILSAIQSLERSARRRAR